MERLTIRSNSGDMVWYKDIENGDAYVEPCEMTPHHSRMAISKLANYEDAEEKLVGQSKTEPSAKDFAKWLDTEAGVSIIDRDDYGEYSPAQLSAEDLLEIMIKIDQKQREKTNDQLQKGYKIQ